MRAIRALGVLLLFVVLLSGCKLSEVQESATLTIEKGSQSLTIQLVSWRPYESANVTNPLGQKIRQFREIHPDIRITILWNDFYGTPSKWLNSAESYKHTDSDEVPDLIELVPNQMRFWYQYGIIEPLPMKETAMSKYLITSRDGYALGVKTKINPLVTYYNKDTFLSLGLEPPSGQWDMDKLSDTIARLKQAGKNVFLPLTPYSLEWITSLNDGHITAPDGNTFSGYVDSPQAVKAAEWIAGVGTNIEDYKQRHIGPITAYFPIPYDLLEGGIALAVDYAYGFNLGDVNSYEEIVQKNERIGIAALPHGLNGVNPAQISGLSMTSQSKHKELAMELLRYLTADTATLDEEIAVNTIESNLRYPLKEPMNDERYSIVLQETRRAIPAELYMFNNLESQRVFMLDRPRAYSEIRSGQPVQSVLKAYAGGLDIDFKKFNRDPAEYDACIASKSYSDTCVNSLALH
ncbi:extracellular solute-binding protein [Paenibacillus sp. PR3]|uniref:Extracellular solute-binding protein n=1 Tax=Paenibacillus terricola TaxID=2763503 RepID=A0ABR8MY09_9BACL|nr:extracellular solute-binding protein [Paenibacillus terricola]MBD3919941.1 extracellular solute-binding protein [Paenibacillus terricola]